MRTKPLGLVIGMIFMAFAAAAGAQSFDAREFGATPGKDHLSTAAIQAAIDACAAEGGGEALISRGDYLSGALELKSGVTLNIAAGATLWASTDPADYPHHASRGRLLNAHGAENVGVTGRGRIHGQGTADYGARWGAPDAPAFRTGVLLFEDCRDVVVSGVQILYSDSWTLHFKRCERVTVDGVTILNNIHRLNSDGIDPNSCRDVRISNCHIVAGDDCIVFKATEKEPCENVAVTNCTLETTTTALKLGTESVGGFRDIHVSNCTIKNTRTGIGFFMKDGSAMERVTFSDISIETMPSEGVRDVFPIFMDIEKRHEETPVGAIRDVIFRGIQIRSGSGVLIQGMPQSPIENLTLDNITLRADWFDDYADRKKAVGGSRTYRDNRDTIFAREPAYITIAHARGVTINNARVYVRPDVYEQQERSALFAHEVERFSIHNLYGDSPTSTQRTSVATLENCRFGVLSGCVAPRVNTAYLRLKGERTLRVLLSGNELSQSDMLIDVDDDVLPGEWKVFGNFELMSRNTTVIPPMPE